jgi:hypothetical protein
MGMGILMVILKRHIIKICVVTLFCIFFNGCSEGKIKTQNKLYVYKTIDAAIKENHNEIAQVIKKGITLNVIRCHDIKSYFILEVMLDNNQSGFIGYGDYRIVEMPYC